MNLSNPETNRAKAIKKYQHKLREMSRKILKNSYEQKYKGKLEYMFIMLINGFIFSWLQQKNYFILPSCEFLSDIVGCSKQWISKLIIKHANLLKIKYVNKDDLTDEQKKYCHHKDFVWMVERAVKLIFNELNIYFFKTKIWKNNCSDKEFENKAIVDYGLNDENILDLNLELLNKKRILDLFKNNPNKTTFEIWMMFSENLRKIILKELNLDQKWDNLSESEQKLCIELNAHLLKNLKLF
ncbi:MAG: hypothetical protein K2K73_03130 [Ureaplasma sp.]|nr:hypothetical protein [Ureaplasma sp.]